MERITTQNQDIFQREFNLSQIAPDAPAADSPEAAERDGLLYTAALRGAHNAPDVREGKVAALKAALADGSYALDAKRIAIALIREDPGLFKF